MTPYRAPGKRSRDRMPPVDPAAKNARRWTIGSVDFFALAVLAGLVYSGGSTR